MARSYPKVDVDGLDTDAQAIALGRSNAEQMGVSERFKFHARDAADPVLVGRYDLVTAFECIHDLSCFALCTACWRLTAPSSSLMSVSRETFMGQGNDVEWMMYGWSILNCLPTGMADQPSAATGTVMRPETLRRYASEAGFRGVEVLPIENYFSRFYRLNP